jgi:hypothetical protein
MLSRKASSAGRLSQVADMALRHRNITAAAGWTAGATWLTLADQ